MKVGLNGCSEEAIEIVSFEDVKKPILFQHTAKQHTRKQTLSSFN